MTNVVGVILAGGQGTRMGGQDKGLLSLGPHTILDEVIRRLAPQVDRLVLNVNGDPARFAHLALPTVPDSLGGFLGPLAGVLAGMEWARAHQADWVATVAADTPFFPLDFVVRCQDACQSGAPIAPQRRRMRTGYGIGNRPLACGMSVRSTVCIGRLRAGYARLCAGRMQKGVWRSALRRVSMIRFLT